VVVGPANRLTGSTQSSRFYCEPQIILPVSPAITSSYPKAGTRGDFFPLTVFFLRDFMVKLFRIFFINWYDVVA
jgi:hypothetical protein